MKKTLIISAFAASFACSALAQPADIIGGAEGAQTVHHCGYLPMSAQRYTNSPTTIRIVESKLIQLGYGQGRPDGSFGKNDKKAVQRFQADYGLTADGVVGPITAQKLAYLGNPSSHVRGCDRLASNF